MRGALGLSLTDFHEKVTFFNGSFWKVYFVATFRESISLKSKQQTFSKLVDWVKSYEPPKCSTVIEVSWHKIGRSMTDRKFIVQSSLFRCLCIVSHCVTVYTSHGRHICVMCHTCFVSHLFCVTLVLCHTCHKYHCHT
jgi:hypothetical protein